ncbi:BRO-N domain-containing protein [Lachnotalea sp. AF33-28]|uniref:BRO-N domain-containing protein n=1 Tax=Lachnotalea sp. AF33-28 TaxID=2292046 RepID=UPI000E4989FF|nr:Bro-N domain-containing protein [Lachnotalea sp. AF33-28]RHP35481.1 hypothetical protein DWZ56_02980 [Lachnotalea sp. AF33-28]
MEKMQIFNDEQFGKIRTVTIGGEPWFVGKDVCAAFGDTNYRRSLGRLDADKKGVSQIETAGGKQPVTVINESGLYSLLFAMQPQKAKGVSHDNGKVEERMEMVRRFRRWITHEVIPAIRRNGGYMTDRMMEEVKENSELIYEIAERIVGEIADHM